jgi:hypothetical protein
MKVTVLTARRPPWLTAAVFLPTAAMAVAQLAVAANIHGAAVLAGTALGLLTVGPPWTI